MKKKIVLVDDNHFLIKVLKEKLSFFDDLEVKFSAKNGLDLMKKLEKDSIVDLILMDIQMPQMDGIEAVTQVKKLYPQIKVLMLTVCDDDENIYRSIKNGADGYLLKEVDPQSLYDDIQTVLKGGAAMTPSVTQKALNLLRSPIDLDIKCPTDFKLSKRETQVLEQLSTGLSYTQIAENLFLSPNTIRKHIENIYKKLEVNSKIEAVQKGKDYRLF